MSESVTVIIPTYNRERVLRLVLSSYAKDPSVSRIIIVDDGSDVDLTHLIPALQQNIPVDIDIIRHRTRRGAPAARMSGVKSANTDWILFGEDDVFLDDGYVATLLQMTKMYHCEIAAGRLVNVRVAEQIPSEGLTPASFEIITNRSIVDEEQVFDLTQFEMRTDALTSEPIMAPYLHAISLVNKTVFEELSFDENFRGNGYREETDFYLTAREHGFDLLFVPSAVCYHLRGPISASGGQRINRLAVEYYNSLNTYLMIKKHWRFLQSEHDFRGVPIGWMIRYIWRRELAQIKRAWKAGFRSTFKA